MPGKPTYDDILARVFDEMHGSLREHLSPAEYAALRDTFIFHMNDWGGDLAALAALRDDPGSMDVEKATVFLVGMLYHVIPHLNAAGRLLLGSVGDPFADDEVYGLLSKAEQSASGR